MTSGPSLLWYTTRATGVMALLLLTGSVVLGVASVARVDTARWPRLLNAGLHRNLSLLAVAFVAVHVVTTILDGYAPIGWLSAIVPFTSPYRTLWLGLGAVAFDLLLAVVITSLVRVRLGYRAWRAVHWLAYASWPVALWHGLGTGTDSKLTWLLALDAACVAAVTGTLGWRLSLARRRPSSLASALACAAVPLATAAFVAVGPLQPGWARRAGTPVTLLAGPASPPVTTAPPTSAPPSPPASGWFSGHAARSTDRASGQVTITVTARLRAATAAAHAQSGGPAQSLVITLRGTPDGAGLTLASGTVSLGPAGAATGYEGPVLRLAGHRLTTELRSTAEKRPAAGPAVSARITLLIRGTVATGRLTVTTGGAR
jgi:methionine sulfoxide reductase heme-binding subunit